MNPVTTAAVIQIIIAALQLAPLTAGTILGIKALLATDPAIPAELRRILAETGVDNAAVLSMVQKWREENPAK